MTKTRKGLQEELRRKMLAIGACRSPSSENFSGPLIAFNPTTGNSDATS
jgi:hypothetical protein